MPTFAESVTLIGDETLDEFLKKLLTAVGETFDLECAWYLSDVLNDGVVIKVLSSADGDSDWEYFKISYERDASTGEFTFGEPQEVQARTVYPAADDSEEDEESDTLLEAVEQPTVSQRKNLPNAAFAALVPQGNGRQPRRILPHHVNTVKDAADNKTVDLPRLRNALARFNQLKDVPHTIMVKAANHLEKHAKALKVGHYATAETAITNADLIEINAQLEEMRLHLARLAKDEATTTAAVPAVTAKLKRKAKKETASDVETVREYTRADPLRDTWLLEGVSDASTGRTAAPNGKPFLATFKGQGGRTNRINRNGRLYVGGHLSENCLRLSEQINRAYANGASPSNHDIVVGHANHPEQFIDYMSMASMLTECREGAGGTLEVEKGILDMPGGRVLMEARSYGIPLGESWVASGKAAKKVMNRENPYFAGNEDFEGMAYDEITDWTVHLVDTVPDPSALVWLESAKVPGDLREQVIALCSDGSKPVNGQCACQAPPITETKSMDLTETKMDEKTLTEALAGLKPADLQRLAPALAEGLVANVKADSEKLEEATNAKFAEFETKLAEQAKAYEVKLAEQAAEVSKLAEARVKAEREAAVLKKLDEITAGKPASEAKRNHVRMLESLGVVVTAENVEDLVSKWEAVNEPLIKALEGKTGTPPERTEEEKAVKAFEAATGPKNGTNGLDHLGLGAIALSQAPTHEGAAR